MLILPAEHPLDWKRPPLVSLLLILLNALIYFVYQGGDAAREQEAVRSYLAGGLVERERPLYLDSLEQRQRFDSSAREEIAGLGREELAGLILFDLQFEQQLKQRPDYRATPEWQQARARAEAARERLSAIRFGFIPERFTLNGLFGAMFLHGSFDHLLGNMLFLFVCGFALETALGAARYLVLYLASGLAAHLLWWAVAPGWTPGIGASGAVSGLMGMYVGLYGFKRINFFYWLGPLFGYFKAPALLILLAWLGKELYGLLSADDHVNYHAHLGGLLFGFAATWLPRRFGRLRVDEAYLDKIDAQAPFKRELARLDQLLGQFALDQAAEFGRDLLQRHPGRLELLERLYQLALARRDAPLLGVLLKQLFALPAGQGLALQRRLADDSADERQHLLQHPAVQLHLLQGLLRERDSQRALGAWRRLSRQGQRPAQLPGLTLQLAKQLGQARQTQALPELAGYLRQAYPDAEQTRQLGLYLQHLRQQAG